MKPQVLAVVLALGVFSCDTPAPETAFFETFLTSLRDRDYRAIANYVEPQSKFFLNGRLVPDADSFVYDGDWIRRWNARGRSLMEILTIGRHTIVPQTSGDGRITFYVIPTEFIEQSRTLEFFQDQWMIEYFACEFALIQGTYKMTENFCFAETDGPLPRPYG